MVIHDFDFVGISADPTKADSPLVVDPDAPLSSPIAAKSFESIPRWNPEVLQLGRSVDLPQLAEGNPLHSGPEPPVKELLGILAPEDGSMITRLVTIDKTCLPRVHGKISPRSGIWPAADSPCTEGGCGAAAVPECSPSSPGRGSATSPPERTFVDRSLPPVGPDEMKRLLHMRVVGDGTLARPRLPGVCTPVGVLVIWPLAR